MEVFTDYVVTFLDFVSQKRKSLVKFLIKKLKVSIFIRRNVDFEYFNEPPKQKQHSSEFFFFSQKQSFQVLIGLVNYFKENPDVRLDDFPHFTHYPTFQICP